MNPAIIFLHQDDDADNVNCDTSVTFIWSFVVAIFCIGGMMGGSVVGLVSSRLGRGQNNLKKKKWTLDPDALGYMI